MKLPDPAIEFRRLRGVLCARSRADHRWYKVRGITRTLASIIGVGFRKHHHHHHHHHPKSKSDRSHNMISMDLFTRVVKDLNSNPRSSLAWVPEYITNLNAPEIKGSAIRKALRQLLGSGCVTPEACRRLWDRSRMSACIGTEVDTQCKDVFNGKKTTCAVGPVSRLILTQLEALCLTPICAGLKVAGVPTPDRLSVARKPGGEVEVEVEGGGGTGSYTYHNGCTRGCTSIRDGAWSFYTEVDLVAHDPVRDNVVLLEVKTRNTDILDRNTLWRYNTQLWLTWVMFSLTYPSVAERSAAYLIVVRPGTNHVAVRNCLRPTMSKRVRETFPWLNCFCPQVLNCLAPTCVNMRVETRGGPLASADGRPVWLDPTELCYRNIHFNRLKRKMGTRMRRMRRRRRRRTMRRKMRTRTTTTTTTTTSSSSSSSPFRPSGGSERSGGGGDSGRKEEKDEA